VICEGPVDAWALGPGGVATCGVGYTAAQRAAASRYPVRVACFDSEPDAQQRAEVLCAELSVMPGQTMLWRLESGKDAATAD